MSQARTGQAKSAELTSSGTPARFEITRVRTPEEDLAVMAGEVREGLEATPPTLPSKYFYDARGSALFDRITTLPEISCKYTRERLERLLEGTGLAVEAWYTDAAEQFAVTLLRRGS